MVAGVVVVAAVVVVAVVLLLGLGLAVVDGVGAAGQIFNPAGRQTA